MPTICLATNRSPHRITRRRWSWLGASIAILATLGSTPASREQPVVTTVTGSGAPAFVDGMRVSFLMPTGVAYDSLGRLYVTDAAAQRVRRVERNGAITTIAGGGTFALNRWSVPGAYRDGAGADARFNYPQGIAIRRNGFAYVADSLNHCIRALSPSGVATTYAGSPTESAHVDGTRTEARFVRPTGMAIDAADNLYVADYSGIRKIDTAGNVTTVPQLGDEPYAVAVIEGALGVTIFAGDRYGIVARHAGADPKEDRRFAAAHAPAGMTTLDTNGDRPLGNPAYLTALDEDTVAFTDARTNTVRLLETVSGELRIIAGTPNDDASGNTGGYRNGVGNDAKFFAPLGITRAPDGGLIVADSGNRRIRRLSPFERIDPWAWLNLAYPGIEAHPRPQDYHIAFIGNSYIWYDTAWSDSIEGLAQASIASDPFWKARRGAPHVIPIIKYSLTQVASFLDNAAPSGLYQMVVLNLNWGTIESSFDGVSLFNPDPSSWQDKLAASLAAIGRGLRARRIPFLVVLHPVSFQVSPSNSYWLLQTYQTPPNQELTTALANRGVVGQYLASAVAKAGVSTLDAGPRISSEQRAKVPRLIFGSGDYHFTRYGRKVMAALIAARLEALSPWRSESK
ncbi:MAG: hypothetical protein JO233_03315 [Candidatus Eremiobacteraeota bacterium]|nr:hypothetical protein [Candidatus Eremiobacteraeota bacterium]